MSKSNADLQDVYERVYRAGEASFFSRFSSGADASDNDSAVLASTEWKGKTVLDVGCGTGHTAAAIASAGARTVTGIDYAPTAIAQARELHKHENLTFAAMDISDWSDPVDIVISCGTLEHMDDPGSVLRRMIEIVGGRGEVIITCPYFINIRGLIWMTLAKLFGVPMSLTDRHFISPFDIERWIVGTSHCLDRTVTFDFDPANGRAMLIDMEKRLTNALRDAGMPNDRVPVLIDWLRDVIDCHERTEHPTLGGRNALYKLMPRD